MKGLLHYHISRQFLKYNLESLRACKRSYKVLEARLKRQFLRTEGDMLTLGTRVKRHGK